ncbi:hypothetical protein B0J17DRAFT_407719 [Rhizoctonia solani]|nr:hypothetical protein B0J17DRAFT_407719 [Rhizoctonia solani]
MTQGATRGPIPKSCLTCRRRRKKCDLRQPVCVRCEKGSFECLGYEGNTRLGNVAHSEQSTPRRILPKPKMKQVVEMESRQVHVQLESYRENDGVEISLQMSVPNPHFLALSASPNTNNFLNPESES